MLDTNTLSYLVQSHPEVSRRVVQVPMVALCMSSIAEAELLYGLARRPKATRLHAAVHELLLRVEVLAWGREAARTYGAVRAELSGRGKTLAPLDLLIAAHALSVPATLVTSDAAFSLVAGLTLEDWTR